jgi:hypothetical protein
MTSSNSSPGLRRAAAITAAALSIGWVGLRLAPAAEPPIPVGPGALGGSEERTAEPVLAEVPAPVVRRELDAARAAAGGVLPAGSRLLEALLSPHAGTDEPPPLRLTPALVGRLARSGMQPFLTRALGSARLAGDTTPPEVAWVAPAAGAEVTPEIATPLAWTATDPSGIYFVDVLASFDGGATFRPMALGLGNSQGSNGGRYQFDWYAPYRPGPAILRLEATDGAFNVGSAERAITLARVEDSLLPTTLRDFDLPGTQPFESFLYGDYCSGCHGNYDPEVEPYFPWTGSMMAQASLDPLFDASLAIAEQDAAGAGDLCLRCHVPQAWVGGRATPSDGSRLYAWDRTGVACDLCHQMLDPLYEPGLSPPEDLEILAGLSDPPDVLGNGSFVLDPFGTRRGPFADGQCAHYFLTSPFHQEAQLCAACHDQGNPIFESDGLGGYTTTFDQRAASFGHGDLMPVDRTFSEWLHSDYNSPAGVPAPEFGGHKENVSTCQDCHLRDVTGRGCSFAGPVREDQPFHDLTGGNTWVPRLIAALYPFSVNTQALEAAVERARYMLQNAALLEAQVEDAVLAVTVTNNTGHKLPTGYPQGRRMWLNVRFFDSANALLAESGRYDFKNGILTQDPAIKLYELVGALDEDVALLAGLPPGPSFHAVLNNRIVKDNRIPPRGFSNAAFAAFGGAPVGYSYADGQHWDVTTYPVPAGTTRVTVTLYYQTASREYVEFLRSENHSDQRGEILHELWKRFDKCPPEVMSRVTVHLDPEGPEGDPLARPRK